MSRQNSVFFALCSQLPCCPPVCAWDHRTSPWLRAFLQQVSLHHSSLILFWIVLSAGKYTAPKPHGAIFVYFWKELLVQVLLMLLQDLLCCGKIVWGCWMPEMKIQPSSIHSSSVHPSMYSFVHLSIYPRIHSSVYPSYISPFTHLPSKFLL